MATNNLTERTKSEASTQERYTVKIRDDGLVDTNGPAEYMEIAKKNAIQSPLLRLPVEIRKSISEYTLSGHVITIQSQSGYLHEIHLQPISKRLAFGLTKVCRQIYAETASIPYALNRFILTRLMIFPYEDRLVYGIYPATMGEWMKNRLPAQLCTTKTVELLLIAWYNNHPLVEIDIWASFPNLERLYVPTSYHCDLGGILERREVCRRNFSNVIFVDE
ncbi:hypothetical protein BS50DRAFT_591190 [Corynespora cassiicola Philippines]|uniref:Uncharacterized protein n=1 Tax=Corynespora cassiicola Philippines TaxID=1448308 RepID=A0A2T2NC16_CORCC|nr:hypothetical protein BS50DRAFT_591190 [Corynespora cassiicola Philippines]